MPSASTAAEPAVDAHTLLGRRNRDGDLGAPQQWNGVLETILNHRSVRSFLPCGLPDGTLELLIAAAQSACTSSNLQFWSVVAVQEAERKSRLAGLAGQQQFIRDAPLLLVWLADLARLDRIAADHQAQVDGTHYVEEFIVGVVDAALAAQSALIAAMFSRCSACRSATLIRHAQPISSHACRNRWCCTVSSTPPNRGAR